MIRGDAFGCCDFSTAAILRLVKSIRSGLLQAFFRVKFPIDQDSRAFCVTSGSIPASIDRFRNFLSSLGKFFKVDKRTYRVSGTHGARVNQFLGDKTQVATTPCRPTTSAGLASSNAKPRTPRLRMRERKLYGEKDPTRTSIHHLLQV